MSDCLILTGMMATGKTSVGRVLAERLDRRFIDIDALIEERAGLDIPELVAQRGEPGLRMVERESVASLHSERAAVIATGGWTLADPDSRATLEALGTIVCLAATPAALAARLGSTDPETRPLLGGDASSDRIRALLDRRRPLYDSLPLQVDTTGRDIETVADHVLALAATTHRTDLTALPVRTPEGGYSVLVGPGLLADLGTHLAARGLVGRTAVVSDPNVNALYGAAARHALERSGIPAARIEMPEGENAKTLAVVSDLYNAFIVSDLDRNGTVIALGGGIVGDTAGYAAATYLRGVRLVQAPTSLLAMVDASIGGKTGVNLPAGKNLVGAFKQPALVVIDPSALRSLPEAEVRNGMAEVIKTALIGDPGLFQTLEDDGIPERSDADGWSALVRRSAAVKIGIVSNDPYESGRRAVLNLGHTFAHALERSTDHALKHGEAVAIGLVAASHLSARLDRADPTLPTRVEQLLTRLGLPVRYTGPTPADVVSAMSTDKKRRSGRLRFVLPHAVGSVEIAHDVLEADALSVVQSLRT